MKAIRLFLTVILAVFIVGNLSSCKSSNPVAKNDRALAIKEKIEDRHYKIEVTRMLPMNGIARELTPSYSLTVQNDTLISYLPYFGQAYSIPYGGGQGLIFTAPITVYSLSFDTKRTATISLQTHSEDDSFTYRLQIFDNGSTTIHVTPNNRQVISFYGTVE